MTLLGEKILNHWRQHQPRLVEQLQKSNQLERSLRETEERTADFLYELLMEQKMDYETAWEIATREWAFLPTEDHPQPSLPTSEQTAL